MSSGRLGDGLDLGAYCCQERKVYCCLFISGLALRIDRHLDKKMHYEDQPLQQLETSPSGLATTIHEWLILNIHIPYFPVMSVMPPPPVVKLQTRSTATITVTPSYYRHQGRD